MPTFDPASWRLTVGGDVGREVTLDYEQLRALARSGSGTGLGLGLAIAKALVEAHGGTIWAENRTQGGARVSFSLPMRAG